MKDDGFYLWNLQDHIFPWLCREPEILEHKEQNIPIQSKVDSSLPIFEQNRLLGRLDNTIRTCLKKNRWELSDEPIQHLYYKKLFFSQQTNHNIKN